MISEIKCRCGAVNRVPRYSIRYVPRCGKCHVKLPETAFMATLRNIYAVPSGLLLSVAVLLIFGWFLSTQSTPSRSTPSPPQVATCASDGPPTIGGIARVYDTASTPALTEITFNAGASANFFVKLYDAYSGYPKIAYFVRGGTVVTTEAPVGSFTVKYASGTNWCNEYDLFGPTTSIQKGTRTVSISEDSTYTLYLTHIRNGNFPTQSISRSDF
jgi:hypothetical protein